MVDLIAHDIKKKKKGRKLPIAREIFSAAKKQASVKRGELLSNHERKSRVKRRWRSWKLTTTLKRPAVTEESTRYTGWWNEDYYLNQCGHGMPVFYGARMQRGHGIGSVISGLLRSIFPVLKRVAPVISKKALQTGIDIESEVAAGQSLKESAKSRVTDALNDSINSFIPTDITQSELWLLKETQRSKKSKTLRKKKLKDIFS